MFVVTFPFLSFSELPFKFVHCYIDAFVSIFGGLSGDENLVMFSPCYYLGAGITILITVNNHLNLIDAVIILWEL